MATSDKPTPRVKSKKSAKPPSKSATAVEDVAPVKPPKRKTAASKSKPVEKRQKTLPPSEDLLPAAVINDLLPEGIPVLSEELPSLTSDETEALVEADVSEVAQEPALPPGGGDGEAITTVAFQPDTVQMASLVYLLWWNWADFSLTVVSPSVVTFNQPKILMPGKEFVYPIHDHGSRWNTSKQADLFAMGKSMCRLHYTIEKIIDLLVQRLKSTNIDEKTEVQVSLEGHELAQRKAFEVIINLKYNVVVTNFNPGAWGDWYLKAVKNLSDKGYGFPPPAPRETYKNPTVKEGSGAPEAKSNG